MGEKGLKMCLMTFNILCLFVGIATFTGGMLLQFNADIKTILQSISDSASETNIGILSVIMLAVGGLVILVSFIGCCGVMSESKCMIGLYCVFLILLLIGQITIGGLGIYYGKQAINDQIDKQIKTLIRESNDQSKQKILDGFQDFFDCCGSNGPDDYPPKRTSFIETTTTVPVPVNITNMTDVSTTGAVSTEAAGTASTEAAVVASTAAPSNSSGYYMGDWPESCCKDGENTTMCQDRSLTIDQLKPYLNEKGCTQSINDFVVQYALIIGAVALGFALLEILSIIAGCLLYKKLD